MTTLSAAQIKEIASFTEGPIGTSAPWESLVAGVANVIHSEPLKQLLRQMNKASQPLAKKNTYI